MIISRGPERLVMVRQVDLLEQCALMAQAWGNGGFGRPSHYDAAVTAARWHDEGWRGWESAPQVDVDGEPLDFPDIDRARHVALYRDGIGEACRRDLRAGLLVSMHGAGLYRGRLGLDHIARSSGERPPAVDAFVRGEDRRQALLRARLGDGPDLERWAWAAYRLLQAWDLLSLALLWGRISARPSIVLPRVPRDEGDTDGVDITVRPIGPWRATCSPWPFAGGRVALPVRARVIPLRRYADDDDLRRTLEATEWSDLPAEVTPG